MTWTIASLCAGAWLAATAGAQPQPTTIRLLVSRLDEVIAKAVTPRGVGHEPSLEDARVAVRESNLLADSVEVTVVIHDITPYYKTSLIRTPFLPWPTVQEDGKLIRGHCVARSKPLSQYRSTAEQERIVKFNEYTNNREAVFRGYPKGLAELNRASHERWRTERRKEYGELLRSIDARAEERKRYCEEVSVELHLPAAACATVDTARLAQATSVKVTARVHHIHIREGHKDLEGVPAVGGLVGEALGLDARFDLP